MTDVGRRDLGIAWAGVVTGFWMGATFGLLVAILGSVLVGEWRLVAGQAIAAAAAALFAFRSLGYRVRR